MRSTRKLNLETNNIVYNNMVDIIKSMVVIILYYCYKIYNL